MNNAGFTTMGSFFAVQLTAPLNATRDFLALLVRVVPEGWPGALAAICAPWFRCSLQSSPSAEPAQTSACSYSPASGFSPRVAKEAVFSFSLEIGFRTCANRIIIQASIT